MYGRLIAIAVFALLFAGSSFAQTATTPTTINITDTAKLKTAKRIGLVLGNQDFYDSGQFMRNLAFRNPGFEGETWQTTMHCQYVTATTCTDDDLYNYWPANFLANASAEFIVGAATGQTTTVKSSTASAIGSTGVTITFSAMATAPAVGDYLVVRMSVPGNAQAGWWTSGTAGTTFTTEFTDLSPNTKGKQALRVTQGTSDQASVTSYMDSTAGHSFLQLSGSYTISFRAKGTGGKNQVEVGLSRPGVSYFDQIVNLTTSWQDYSYTFTAQDTGVIGTLAYKFYLPGSSMLIDDVTLTAAAASTNPTVYRNEVVAALRTLKPGILRFMDSGTDWGSSIDNMLQPDFVRQRAGYSDVNSEMDDIPMNLHDYLVLCQTIGAEPWYTMPTGMSTQEMSNLMDYFGGTTSTVYGARRAALGQTAAWTTVFPKIHLEFGNEVWNVSNPGANMTDALSYGRRASAIFTTAKKSASYNANVFDLVQDGMEANPSWTQLGLSTSTNYDTVDSTAYIFSNLNDSSSTEAIYGSMFAEPEFLDSTSAGQMSQMAAVAAAATPPARLSIYEMNMGTNQGSAAQAVVNSTVAGAGAGIAVADNMLLLMRDLGVTDQNMFSLQGLTAPFNGTGGATSAPIWGIVIDMGGATNLKRPQYLTQMMANSAILPTLLSTSQTGANPTWNQAYTTNDNFSLTGAHYIQSFAFTDGTKLNIILFNLSRTTALPINFAGLNTPLGAAAITTLAPSSLSATNETADNVTVQNTTQTLTASSTMTLPAYSMTVVSVNAPTVPVLITSLTASCARASLSPGGTTACTATVTGQGKYNAGITWAVDNGSISTSGVYTAPATIPASGKATITATSAQDTTKKATITVLLGVDAITGVTASCTLTTLGQGNQTSCTATVAGTGSFSSAYTWKASAGTIAANGTLTAPATGTSMTVTATSTQDATKSATVAITLTPFLIMGTPSGTATTTTATINWTLNMAAHSGISYGPTSALGLSTAYIASTSAAPSITLSGLTAGTTYYMTAYSFINNQTVSESYNITTPIGSSTVTGVTLTCAATSVKAGATDACTPKVTGTGSFSSGVTWSTSAGSITTAGVLTTPTTGTSVTVKATSTQDMTKSASLAIAVTPVASTITAVTLTCAATSVKAGATDACTPKVTGTGSFSSGVTWSTSAGSITTAGVLTALTTGTSVTVKATSTQDTTKSASVAVAVTGATTTSTITAVTLTCALSSVKPGNAVACTTKVAGTGSYTSQVTWSTSAGSINAGGVLTAPSTGTSVTVKATSVQDKTKSASVTIAITPTITSVALTCAVSSVKAGGAVACTTKVAGTGNFSSQVTWSASAGSVNAGGVVTTPTTGTSVTVKATSTQDTTKSASAVIKINGA